NSLKYAFPSSKNGKLTIDFFISDNEYFNIIIADNGVGLPENTDIENADTLGLNLIKDLATQLKSKLVLEREEGTKYTLKFKFKKKFIKSGETNPPEVF
ncbi:MAG: hypothetical protein ACOCV8_03110, partial [Spirochaetota bacterium]